MPDPIEPTDPAGDPIDSYKPIATGWDDYTMRMKQALRKTMDEMDAGTRETLRNLAQDTNQVFNEWMALPKTEVEARKKKLAALRAGKNALAAILWAGLKERANAFQHEAVNAAVDFIISKGLAALAAA